MGPGEFVGVFGARGVPEHAQDALETLAQKISPLIVTSPHLLGHRSSSFTPT
jgi:hypothetical protein